MPEPPIFTADERKRHIDTICGVSDRLNELAKRYERLRHMAESDCSGAFLLLAESAGRMAEDSLSRLAALLDILHTTQRKESQDGEAT